MKYLTPQTPDNQQGAVLITALVFLVIMTLLALSAMNTTTLEEKMAANSQEINRAFQASETGLDIMMSDTAAFDTRYTVDQDGTGSTSDFAATYSIGAYGATLTANSVYLQETTPGRSAEASAANIVAHHHFKLTGNVVTGSGVTSTVNGGVYWAGPPLN